MPSRDSPATRQVKKVIIQKTTLYITYCQTDGLLWLAGLLCKFHGSETLYSRFSDFTLTTNDLK